MDSVLLLLPVVSQPVRCMKPPGSGVSGEVGVTGERYMHDVQELEGRSQTAGGSSLVQRLCRLLTIWSESTTVCLGVCYGIFIFQ